MEIFDLLQYLVSSAMAENVVASAADVAPPTTVDFSTLIQAAGAVAIGVAAWVVRTAGKALTDWLSAKAAATGNATAVDAANAANDLIHRAAETAAVAAKGKISAMTNDLSSKSKVDVHNAELAEGIRHVMAAVPEALAAQNVGPDVVAGLVAAQLARLDPNVHTEPVSPQPPN